MFRIPKTALFPLLALLLTLVGCKPKNTGLVLSGGNRIAGLIAGQFQVNANGEATYSMDLVLPPGTNDLSPKLGIVYQSQTGGGTLGRGFGLSGLSRIARMGANPNTDGFRGGVYYDGRDRFALDDTRLILVKGSAYGADGATYHTQIESWKKVVSNGSCGSGPCSFTVTGSTGIQYQYGATTDSRVLAQGSTFKQGPTAGSVREWLVNQVKDLSGNTMAFSYTMQPRGTDGAPLGDFSADGVAYPTRITYTSNAGAPARRSVQFFYEFRSDSAKEFQGGAKMITVARLAAVRSYVYNTKGDSLLATSYTFHYQADAPLNVSRIDTILQSDAADTSFAPTTFQWTDPANGFVDQGSFPYGGNSSNAGWTGDFNGDGLTDILPKSPSALYFGGATGFTTQTLSPQPLLSPFTWVADFNADGLDDILTVSGSNGKLYFATGTGFSTAVSTPSISLNSSCTNCAWVADYNGDGRADLFTRMGTTGYTLYLGSATQNGLSAGVQLNAPNMSLSNGATWASDFNGDGLSDLLNLGNTSGKLYVSNLSDSTGFRPGISLAGLNLNLSCSTCLLPMDVNGDGLLDLFAHVNGVYTAYYATGAGFSEGHTISGISNKSSDMWSGDFNGDGWVDFYVPGGSTDSIYYAVGDGFEAQATAGRNFSTSGTWSGDFNGDGLADLFAAGTKTMYFGGPEGQSLPTQNQIPHLATQIANGIGGQWDLKYLPLTNPAVYSKGTVPDTLLGGQLSMTRFNSVPSPTTPGAATNPGMPVSPYPVHLVQAAQYVVQAHTVHNGRGKKFPSSYFYTNALVDLGGEGWLGFASMRKTNDHSGLVTLTEFIQAFPFTGKTAVQETRCDSSGKSNDPRCMPNALLTSTATQYLDAGTTFQPYPGVYQILPTQSVQTTYDYGSWAYAIGINSTYDGFGNEVTNSYLGYLNENGSNRGTSDDVYTLSTYINDTSGGAWLVGFAQNKKVSSSNDASQLAGLNCTVTPTFGTGDFSISTNTYSTDGRMLVLQTCDWDNTNNVWLSHTMAYDQYGNDTLQVDAAGGRTRAVYDTVYHTFKAIEMQPGEVQGQYLTSYYGFDPRFGAQIALTDPNGNTSITALDGFGRMVATQGPLPDSIAVEPSHNLVNGWVTGLYDFASAPVVTLQTGQWLFGDSSGIYNQVSSLQTWNGGPDAWAYLQTWQDGLQQEYMTVAQGPQDDPRDVITVTNFNSAGNPTSKSLPYYAGDPVYWNTTAYDLYGRPIRAVIPRGPQAIDSTVAIISYSYNDYGTVAKQTFGTGTATYERIVTKHTLNNQPLTDSIIVPADSNAVTDFRYDALGRLTTVRSPLTAFNPQGLTTDYAYDAIGRMTAFDAPGLGTTKYTYAPNGQLASKTDAKGTTTYKFDLQNRLLLEQWWDGTTIVYDYDSTGVSHGLGKLTRAAVLTSQGATQSQYIYNYDPYEQVARQSISVAGAPGIFELATLYDPQGRIWVQTNPDGTVITNTYARSQLRAVSMGGIDYATFTDYTAQNDAGTLAYNNGVTTYVHYGVDAYETGRTVGTTGTAYLHDSTLWNDLGQATAINDLLLGNGDQSKSFGYTNMRLTSAHCPSTYGTLDYRFDPSGNLLQKDSLLIAYTGYQATGAEAGGRQVYAAQYDPVGNLVQRYTNGTTWTFGYDADRHLTLAINESTQDTTRYLVDYQGNRICSIEPEGVVTYYIGTTFELVVEAGAKYQFTNYVVGPEGRVASVTQGNLPTEAAGMSEPGTLYYHNDRLHSTSFTTDAAGDTVSAVLYEPYGGVFALRGQDDFRYKFTGQELDENTNLYNFQARYYDPFIGRFTTADNQPGGDPEQQDVWNRYQYVLGDPVRYTDPTGNAAWEDIVNGLVIGLSILIDIVQPEMIPETVELDVEVVEETEAVTEAEEIAEESGDFCGCFTRYTPVQTPNGPVAIQDIQVGDTVWAFDPATRQRVARPVVDIFHLQRHLRFDLYYDGHALHTTGDHPFFTGQGWKTVDALVPGDFLLLENGDWVQLDSMEVRSGNFRVYNFTVEGLHSYYAGDDPVAVHNGKCVVKRKKRYDPLSGNLRKEKISARADKSTYRQGTGTDANARSYVNSSKTKVPYKVDYEYKVYDQNGKLTTARRFNDIPNPEIKNTAWDAGHIVGRQHGGSGTDPINLFAQNRDINRGWNGNFRLWRRLEDKVARYQQINGNTVKLIVRLYYK